MASGGMHRKKKKTEKSNRIPSHSSTPSSSSSSSSPSSPSSAMSRFPSYRCVACGVPFAMALCLLLFLGISSNAWNASPHISIKTSKSVLIHTGDVLNEFHHDRKAFTQGLLYWKNDTLYESTGLYGQSSLRRVALRTGKVEAEYKLDDAYFGEGLTLLGERFYQLTWLRQLGFIYDRNNLSKVATFTHQMNDGWGLATDGKILFGSDGSSTLFQIDPQTMNVIKKQTISYEGHEVYNLNELEYVNGEVWANIWQADCIARISPGDGTVVGWILLQNLRERLIGAGEKGFDVLNGIAWDNNKQRIFVTGKLWPKLYEIKLQPVKDLSRIDVKQLCLRKHDF